MLRIDTKQWIGRLERVPWSELFVDFNEYTAALKQCIPELSGYIDKKLARVRRDEKGCIQMFFVLERHEDTGEQFSFEIAFASDSYPLESPDHIHNRSPFADYGEEYGTLTGEIDDQTDEGVPFTHRRGKPPVRHGPETRHQPVIRDVWVGWFYQPAGSRLAEMQ